MERAVQAGLARSDDETWRKIQGCLTPGRSQVEQAAVVSLWPVDDASRAVFMTTFYAHVKGGLPPALARAKQELRASTAHAHPFYWAPFVFFGAD
jgi:CHAT domain